MKHRPDKTKSNRANALKSTGPRSEEGKQTVALNGITHGLRSLKPVIPWLESEADWQEHRRVLVEQIGPVGAVEMAMADRIALGLWRLCRCAEAEPRILSAIREKRRWNAIQDALNSEHLKLAGEPAAEVMTRLTDERDRLCALAGLWESLLGKPSKAAVDADLANDLIDSFCDFEFWTSIETEFSETFVWPPPRLIDLRAMVEWLLERLYDDSGTALVEVARRAQEAAKVAARRIDRIEEASKQAMQLAMFEVEACERMLRAETSIHRTLQKDLHELQRLQATRLGHPVAVPIALDVTTDS